MYRSPPARGAARAGRGEPVDEVIELLPALQQPTVSSLADADWVDVITVLDESVVRRIIPRLKDAGARGIVEYSLNKVIE